MNSQNAKGVAFDDLADAWVARLLHLQEEILKI